MPTNRRDDFEPPLTEVQNWVALGSGVALLLMGARRRPAVGLAIAAAAAPLLYRGLTGQWPAFLTGYLSSDDTRVALAGDGGIHVRESVRVELPIMEVYRFWRDLGNLPRFTAHLESVAEGVGTRRSHWVALGPAGVRVEWDAELINEVENKVLAWRSLPGSDVVTAGSVNFDAAQGGRSTQVSVHLPVRATRREGWRTRRVPLRSRAFSDRSRGSEALQAVARSR